MCESKPYENIVFRFCYFSSPICGKCLLSRVLCLPDAVALLKRLLSVFWAAKRAVRVFLKRRGLPPKTHRWSRSGIIAEYNTLQISETTLHYRRYARSLENFFYKRCCLVCLRVYHMILDDALDKRLHKLLKSSGYYVSFDVYESVSHKFWKWKGIKSLRDKRPIVWDGGI